MLNDTEDQVVPLDQMHKVWLYSPDLQVSDPEEEMSHVSV